MLFVPRKLAGKSETYTHHNKTKEKTATYTQISWRYIQHQPVPPPVPINTTGSFKRLALSYQTKNFENPIQPNETEQKKKIYFTTTKQQQPFFYFDKYLQNYSFCFLTPKIKLNRKGKKNSFLQKKKIIFILSNNHCTV